METHYYLIVLGAILLLFLVITFYNMKGAGSQEEVETKAKPILENDFGVAPQAMREQELIDLSQTGEASEKKVAEQLLKTKFGYEDKTIQELSQ